MTKKNAPSEEGTPVEAETNLPGESAANTDYTGKSPNDEFPAQPLLKDPKDIGRLLNLFRDVFGTDGSEEGDRAAFLRIVNDRKTLAAERNEQGAYFIAERLREDGDFLVDDLGEGFFAEVPEDGQPCHLLAVEDGETSPFVMHLHKRFGLSRSIHSVAFGRVFEHIRFTLHNLKPSTVKSGSYYDVKNQRVFIDRYDGWMYVLDGLDVHTQAVGARIDGDGNRVWFYPRPPRSEYPKPFTYIKDYIPGIAVDHVGTGPNLESPEDAECVRHMLFTWVLAQFLYECLSVRPVVGIFGPENAGKSEWQNRVNALMYGVPYDSLPSLPADDREYKAVVYRSRLSLFDNAGAFPAKVQDLLCQSATGGLSKMRKMHTNFGTEMVALSSSVAVSGLSARGLQSDLTSRMLLVNAMSFDPSVHTPVPQSELQRVALDGRDYHLSEMMDIINRLLLSRLDGETGERAHRTRFGDFESLLYETAALIPEFDAVKTVQYISRAKAGIDRRNNPLIDKIVQLVETRPDVAGEFNKTGDLYEYLRIFGNLGSIKNGRDLGSQLCKLKSNGSFEHAGVTAESKIVHKANQWCFSRRDSGPEDN
ncbi:hypothetical protein OG785_33315 [Streptomyces sp. NBC_00006]|uniref:hypothetical protein n=1 Tax=Streptomyces sp. NBC_00006 TaxID=2975619 RepID=UPI00224FBE2E|nr:hypothetical protein [Streptomyces sp. NBC_00006]MCX5535419.1 hypothetical protein [Streptomyces sp. NBC_00006]